MKTIEQPASSRIITVTVNTASDHIIQVDRLCPGDNIIATDSVVYASGKGINVAKSIESLGGRVSTLGFVGRESKDFFNSINSEWLATDFTLVDGSTRSNLTLSESQTGSETHIRTRGYSVNAADCRRLMDKIDEHLNVRDTVILSGSLPADATARLYQDVIQLCRNRTAAVFLDSSGEGLNKVLVNPPDLIKPNLLEFEQLTGQQFLNEQAIVEAARDIIEQGVQRVIVSCGDKGAIFVDAEQAYTASVDVGGLGRLVTQVGCGDALLGGFAWAVQQGQSLTVAIATSVSCAAANLFSAEPGRFEQKRFLQVEKHVRINPL